MDASIKPQRLTNFLAILLLQLFLTQVFTFLLSLFLGDIESFPRDQPLLFAGLLTISFTAGVFIPGWLGLKWRWLVSEPANVRRLLWTLVGVILPLFLGLIVSGWLQPGSPFFALSILSGILGFYLPDLRARK